MLTDATAIREVTQAADAMLPHVETLYDATQHPDERIPFAWIRGGLKGNAKAGGPSRHLLIAESGGRLAGFIAGSHLPHYGGYVSYLGVDPAARGRGVATGLFHALFGRLERDAALLEEVLPFVVWESKPTGDATWQARLALFAKVGAYPIEGIELHTKNYADDAKPGPVLRLFVKPGSWSKDDMTPTRLKVIAEGVMSRVYRLDRADELWQRSFGYEPELSLGASPAEIVREQEQPAG